MKIKMESFDLMQYFYGSVHDPLIHGLFRLSGHLDAHVLKKAVTLSEKAVPLIGCICRIKAGGLRWEQRNFTGEDMVHIVEAAADDEGLPESLLASPIDITREPQLKIFLIRYADNDTLCVIINHMVTDGAGFKEYLYLLCSLYACCRGETTDIPDLTPFPRGTGQLFRRFGPMEKLGILFSKYDLSMQKRQSAYKLEGDRNNPFFATYRIGREEFLNIKACAKGREATVNDMIIAAYARVLAEKTADRHVILPCPVDLRKYRPEAYRSVSNLTSNYICELDIGEDSPFDDTLTQVSGQMGKHKQSDNCLKSVISLEAAFHILPFRILQKGFRKVFTIPVVSYTNLGILNKEKLRFEDIEITDAFLTGTVKYVPYFQIAVSTFDDAVTLSCNLHGTPKDRENIDAFLKQIHQEITTCLKAV